MGDLVTLNRSMSSFRRELPPGATAEILFFTGVRYYRFETEAEMPRPVRRRSDKVKRAAEERRRQQLS